MEDRITVWEEGFGVRGARIRVRKDGFGVEEERICVWEERIGVREDRSGVREEGLDVWEAPQIFVCCLFAFRFGHSYKLCFVFVYIYICSTAISYILYSPLSFSYLWFFEATRWLPLVPFKAACAFIRMILA